MEIEAEPVVPSRVTVVWAEAVARHSSVVRAAATAATEWRRVGRGLRRAKAGAEVVMAALIQALGSQVSNSRRPAGRTDCPYAFAICASIPAENFPASGLQAKTCVSLGKPPLRQSPAEAAAPLTAREGWGESLQRWSDVVHLKRVYATKSGVIRSIPARGYFVRSEVPIDRRSARRFGGEPALDTSPGRKSGGGVVTRRGGGTTTTFDDRSTPTLVARWLADAFVTVL